MYHITTWSGAHRWPYVFLDFGYFVLRFTMFGGFFSPQPIWDAFFVSLEQSQNKFDKRCRISAGLFPRNTWVRHVHWNQSNAMCGCNPLKLEFVFFRFKETWIFLQTLQGLDMCKVCTEAVHCVALWTRVTSQVWTCVWVALWTRVTSQVWTCVRYVPKQSIA